MSKGKGDRKGQKRRVRQRAKARRTEWFKKNGPCVQCGSRDHLELDHIIPTLHKNNFSHDVWFWSEHRRQHELSKCQILCKSCHCKKTRTDLRKYEHGLNLYDRHGCRCEVCRAANAASKRRQRAGRRIRENEALAKEGTL